MASQEKPTYVPSYIREISLLSAFKWILWLFESNIDSTFGVHSKIKYKHIITGKSPGASR